MILIPLNTASLGDPWKIKCIDMKAMLKILISDSSCDLKYWYIFSYGLKSLKFLKQNTCLFLFYYQKVFFRNLQKLRSIPCIDSGLSHIYARSQMCRCFRIMICAFIFLPTLSFQILVPCRELRACSICIFLVRWFVVIRRQQRNQN